MPKRNIILFFLLGLFASVVQAQSPVLCMDGTLLFREDFGGNDPNDPIVGTQRVDGMDYSRYTQRTNADHVTGQPGLFWLIKSGYYHADTTGGRDPMANHSNWYLQDDHTYPDDKTRGYLLEIDGLGDNSSFYTKVIHDVCPGSRLTFSAYVANVNKASNYLDGRHARVYPRLRFELQNAENGTVLATQSTGDIPYDASLPNPTDFFYSSKWYLHGMTLMVPPGVDSIRLTIYNDVSSNGAGNDFALDDIEIHFCYPEGEIEGLNEVCVGSSAQLEATWEATGDMVEPLEFKWLHSEDSITWTEINGVSTFRLALPSVQKSDSGWYRAAMAEEGNISRVNCRTLTKPFRLTVNECEPPQEELCVNGTLLFREDFGGNDPDDPAMSMGSVPGMSSQYHNSGNSLGSGNYTVRKEGWANGIQWHRQDDHTYPDDKTRGYLLEVDGIGGAEPFYSTTIDGLCAGSKLTFSAYVVNVHYAGQLDYFGTRYVYPRMKFVLKDPATGAVLAEKSTGDIQPDWRYGTPDTWKYARDNSLSAEWQLVGINFVVPDGIESIQMFIYNDVERNGSGNDFALDDIEIHLCAPPVTIEGETEVCTNTSTTLTANFSNDGTFAEPLEYKWWFSTDSLTWTELSGSIGQNLTFDAVQKADSGWYKVAVSGAGNIESVNCRAQSTPFLMKVNECIPSVRILSPDSVCPNDPCAFQIEITNENTLQGPLVYQWLYRSLEYPTEWRNVSGGTVRELQIASFQTQHVGWYKLYVAEAGKINNPDERIESEEFFVTFKKCEPDLCTDGTLLYKDDFGGNSPSDPRVGQVPVQGMSYRQLNNDSFGRMGSGCYLVTKSGYCNGDTAAAMRNYGYVRTWDSQWILQDDHTYMGDYSRGYFVEIDGAGGQSPFYSTTISGLCPGSKLTFSAHVVNVAFFEWVQKMYRTNRSYIYPRLKFVLKNPVTGAVLAEQSTGNIQPDITKSWNILLHESAEWQLVGMNFTVPEGIEAIQMFIYNDVERDNTGNDFALDDIEIHLCLPPVTIAGDEEVCLGSATSLTADFTNDGTLAEPLEYKWWHSEDSLVWTELPGFIGPNPTIDAVHKADSGWYKVAVSGAGNIESVNCRALSEPFRLSVKDCPSPEPELCMDGTLLFREDFGGNDPNEPRVGQDPVNGMTYNQLLDDYFGIMRSGSYLLTKQGYCNGDTSVNNLPQNRGSQWHLQDDHTYPNDITRGYLLEIDGRGDNAVFYAKTIDGLCAGSKLTFSAYVANVMTWGQYVGRPGYYSYPRLKFVLRNSATTEVLATYDTGEIPFDSAYINNYQAWQFSSQWRLAGMNFTVPEGVEAIILTISNNTTGYVGNDFAIDDVEIRLCMPSPAIVSENTACLDSVYEFAVDFTNDGTLAEPLEYKWWHSEDSLVWTELPGFIGPNPTIDAVHKADSGWYKVAVSGAGNIESVNCRAQSTPFRLNVQACAPPPCPDLHYATRDTTVCDTLMPFTWHGLLFNEPGEQKTLEKDNHGCDTLQTTWTLLTQVCCPDIQTFTLDTTVCDTLMPFVWIGDGFEVPFSDIGTNQQSVPHPRWPNCLFAEYTLRLDTVHCERLYDIIVNKYNWVLLCNNTRVRTLFPQRTVIGYQWYKDGTAIIGATEDDYSEQNELQGDFQLRLHMDDGSYVWSEILTIQPALTQAPSRIRIYRHNGHLIYQAEGENTVPSLPRGLYIIQIEQNGEQRIEKKLIP